MKWSYILFLPAAVSVLWALCTLFLKRRPTPAQWLLCAELIVVSAAMAMLAVFFRGHSGGLFLYDYLFECLSMLCAPLFYIGMCSLTEPRGVTRRQRWVFLVPVVFIAGLTAGAVGLGWRRYEALCVGIRDGVEPAAGVRDAAWQFMYFWDHRLFPVLLLTSGAALVFAGMLKVRQYQSRFNRYYADNMGVRYVDGRWLVALSCIFLPLGVAAVLLIYRRPWLYKYWLIAVAALVTVVQWFFGRFVYRADYDARYLADLMRTRFGQEQ